MAEERFESEQAPLAFQLGDASKEALHKAGRVAIAAALVTTLATGPVKAEAYELPQPIPIVYVMQPPVPDEPAASADEPQDDEDHFWRRLLKMLKWALIVLLLLVTCAFGALKGCAGLIAAPALPAASASSAVETAASL